MSNVASILFLGACTRISLELIQECRLTIYIIINVVESNSAFHRCARGDAFVVRSRLMMPCSIFQPSFTAATLFNAITRTLSILDRVDTLDLAKTIRSVVGSRPRATDFRKWCPLRSS